MVNVEEAPLYGGLHDVRRQRPEPSAAALRAPLDAPLPLTFAGAA
jgi:hypothetical protein